MILGICTGQVYITLNVFIIVLEACLKLRADLTNIPTSGRASQLSRAPKTVLLSKVTLTLGINNFLVVWIENLSNFKHFHISAMSDNRITADYEFFCDLAVTATCPRAVDDLLTGLTIHRARVKHFDSYSSFI